MGSAVPGAVASGDVVASGELGIVEASGDVVLGSVVVVSAGAVGVVDSCFVHAAVKANAPRQSSRTLRFILGTSPHTSVMVSGRRAQPPVCQQERFPQGNVPLSQNTGTLVPSSCCRAFAVGIHTNARGAESGERFRKLITACGVHYRKHPLTGHIAAQVFPRHR